MRISEILKKDGATLSFEVFPPKSDAGFDTVKAAVEEIAKLRPAYLSVTYGAGGGTSKYTLDIARSIKETLGVPTLAHLTCVSSSRRTVAEKIAEIKAAGIENVMALRGDVPEEMKDTDRGEWDYTHATELVRELRLAGDFCIGGACYPECHPESASREADIYYLKQKVDTGCDFLTTQMFFDNSLYYRFIEETQAAGISLPVIPGVMPITSASQIDRVLKLSGCYLPRVFTELVSRYGDNPSAMCEAGVEYATEQIAKLFENGVKNVHVYTMNKPEVAKKIMENLRGIIK